MDRAQKRAQNGERERKRHPYDRNENSVMDADIKTSHLFLPMKKLFIIRDICEGTYGSLITGNNMTSTSDGFEHKTE